MKPSNIVFYDCALVGKPVVERCGGPCGTSKEVRMSPSRGVLAVIGANQRAVANIIDNALSDIAQPCPVIKFTNPRPSCSSFEEYLSAINDRVVAHRHGQHDDGALCEVRKVFCVPEATRELVRGR